MAYAARQSRLAKRAWFAMWIALPLALLSVTLLLKEEERRETLALSGVTFLIGISVIIAVEGSRTTLSAIRRHVARKPETRERV